MLGPRKPAERGLELKKKKREKRRGCVRPENMWVKKERGSENWEEEEERRYGFCVVVVVVVTHVAHAL